MRTKKYFRVLISLNSLFGLKLLELLVNIIYLLMLIFYMMFVREIVYDMCKPRLTLISILVFLCEVFEGKNNKIIFALANVGQVAFPFQ